MTPDRCLRAKGTKLVIKKAPQYRAHVPPEDARAPRNPDKVKRKSGPQDGSCYGPESKGDRF